MFRVGAKKKTSVEPLSIQYSLSIMLQLMEVGGRDGFDNVEPAPPVK